jgi:putative transposase
MSVRILQFVNGECYHIYNRGNSKQVIFHDVQDHEYFIKLLQCMNTEDRIAIRDVEDKNSLKKECIVSIGSYCLMPNHFHILLKQEKEGGVSKFMQKISTAYVMYYNKKYKHSGSLFEGKFKSKYSGTDVYLRYLFSYIHLNPLKILDHEWKLKASNIPETMLHFLESYRYSSFLEYYTNTFTIVAKDAFPDYFPTRSDFVKDIQSWFPRGSM